jgi:CspA family cold shock protein
VQRLHGTVARWHAKGGWGFITRDDGLGDAFVHQRSIQKNGYRSLLEGERVEFDVTVRPPAQRVLRTACEQLVRPRSDRKRAGWRRTR